MIPSQPTNPFSPSCHQKTVHNETIWYFTLCEWIHSLIEETCWNHATGKPNNLFQQVFFSSDRIHSVAIGKHLQTNHYRAIHNQKNRVAAFKNKNMTKNQPTMPSATKTWTKSSVPCPTSRWIHRQPQKHEQNLQYYVLHQDEYIVSHKNMNKIYNTMSYIKMNISSATKTWTKFFIPCSSFPWRCPQKT